MADLACYISAVYDNKPVHPNGLTADQIFGKSLSTPYLDKTRPNRILIFHGAFNPPHQGHLQLLKHTFLHGVHDLNVVAAIIAPRSDDSIRRKCEDVGNTFMFGIGERCLLWEQHISLPTWAWVYQDTTKSFHGFVDRLKQKTKEDGYEVEFITMYGPEIGSPDDPPDPAYASYGSTTVIMSDAARDASFQRSNGRLKDFKGCSKWRRVCVNKAQLEERVRDHARRTMQRMNAACSGEAQISLEEDPFSIERTTRATVTRALKDLGTVLYCQNYQASPPLTIRFIRAQYTAPRYYSIRKISSTKVRAIMKKHDGRRMKEALEDKALSPYILWQTKSVWVDAAKQGANTQVNFPHTDLENLDTCAEDKASVDCYADSSTRSDCSDDSLIVEDQKLLESNHELSIGSVLALEGAVQRAALANAQRAASAPPA